MRHLQGDRHRPRNGKGGNTCSASQCKKSYQAQREMQQKLGGNELPSVASFNELPENKTVRELNQILGERCCDDREQDHWNQPATNTPHAWHRPGSVPRANPPSGLFSAITHAPPPGPAAAVLSLFAERSAV